MLILTLLPNNDFEAPLVPYGSGHRGIDVQISKVRSPIDGEVRFAGKVFNRNALTVENDEGKFSFEPVCSDLGKGDTVVRGQLLGFRCDSDNYEAHCNDCVHISYRDPGYRNPLWVLGFREPSRAVLGPGVGLRITLSESFN
jgi:hypothetical protein